MACSTTPSTVGMAFSLSPRAASVMFLRDAAGNQGFTDGVGAPHRQGQIALFGSGPVGMAGCRDLDPVDPLGGGIGQHLVDDGPGVWANVNLVQFEVHKVFVRRNRWSPIGVSGFGASRSIAASNRSRQTAKWSSPRAPAARLLSTS